MLLRILQLKDTPPYGGPSEGGGGGRGGGRTVTVPDSLHGVEILAPELQRWLLERIRWVGFGVCLVFLPIERDGGDCCDAFPPHAPACRSSAH